MAARKQARGISLVVVIFAVIAGVRVRQPGESYTAAAEPAEATARTQTAERPKIDFARQIRPLLEKHCHECHGATKQESGFRLDLKAAAIQGGDIGRAIEPGKSGESRLIQAIIGTADDISQMPLEREPLSQDEIALLRAWIDQGAVWPETEAGEVNDAKDHWAFQSPVRPTVPETTEKNWPRNPIDGFVVARLESEGLQPSAGADRATLLRRLSLDLIGLPPTIAERDSFLADQSPDAYGKQVERLLASPHYGERWGRHWLDAARYADSDGFEKDKSRTVWFYRDWVVNAFNRDLPYDQFIIEQLAGDQLENATQDQIVATGFLRNSMLNEEGGIDPEQFRMEAMFDRMDAIGKGMLGLTIQCAQCHTHKFDPLLHEEYYRLFAFLNNDHEAQRLVYTPDEMMTIDRVRRERQAIEAELQHKYGDWQERMARWEDQAKASAVEWKVLVPDEASEPEGGAKITTLKDHSMLCSGYAPTKCNYLVKGQTDLRNITAIRLEALNDPNLPAGGPGRSFKGTFALTQIKIEAAPSAEKDKKQPIKIAKATADFAQNETPLEPNFDDRSGKKRMVGPVEFAIDGKDETAWGIDSGNGRRNQPRNAVFVFEKPIDFENGAALAITLTQNHGGWNSDDHQNNLLGRFRISVTTASSPVADPLPAHVREILSIPRDQRSPSQITAVFNYWRTTVPEWKEANERIEELWKQWPAGSTQLTVLSREEPRATHVLRRGDFLKPTESVTAGVPAFLHPLPADAPPTRLTFARWLADRRSPTTARAMVNRIWQAYFGTGIVSTAEDLGTQSEPPSHPALLDWLAVEFMDHGWSIKHVHRLIVTSATYRQSSHVTPELYARDQYNRLLARGPRLRVEGEIVRDIALAVSGLLNPRIGGPSVMPPAPEFLFRPPASYAPFPWVEATGPDRYRRALYTFRRRSTPYPMLSNFDVPNADTSCVRRVRSNTPLQALTTLNEALFVESAQALGRRMLAEGGKNDPDRLSFGFQLCTSRVPTDEERNELLALLRRTQKRIADGWISPWQIATGKEEKPAELPTGATPAHLGAYAVVARVLLNLDETITKE
ncbi:MAG: PSD1 and planctomycete cytochrome C domain-containing protein [Pirellulales bacterium]